jgi:hypothetical protein
MNKPFAYVLFINRGNEERLVSLHQSLDEAEDALRAYARTVFVSPGDDDELVEALAECDEHVHIFACTMKRNTQISTELQPFTRATEAA